MARPEQLRQACSQPRGAQLASIHAIDIVPMENNGHSAPLTLESLIRPASPEISLDSDRQSCRQLTEQLSRATGGDVRSSNSLLLPPRSHNLVVTVVTSGEDMTTEHTDLTSERLSMAVWRTVAEDGIEGTSVRRVAQKAGCTTGLIMHHFGSRGAMLKHAREVLYKRTEERANIAEDKHRSPRDRLKDVLCGALPLDAKRKHEARVWAGFAATALSDEAMRKIHVSGNRRWLERITRILSTCNADASMDCVEIAAIQLIAATEGLALLASLDPETYSAEIQKSILAIEVDNILR